MIGQFIVKKEFLMKKKPVLLLLLIALLTLTFTVIGCGSSGGGGDGGDGGGGGGGSGTSVEGTWKAKLQDQPDWNDIKGIAEIAGISGSAIVAELKFTGGNVTLTEIDPKDGTRETSTGTYVQAGNTVTITIDGEPGVATISGNKLTITDEDGPLIFYKS